MFTGIVTATGSILRVEARPEGRRLGIAAGWQDPDLQLGESVAVDGCCLTVVAADGARFEADVSAETLDRTTLGALAPGDRVNLERALRAGDRLGGHLVSGHVDGRGRVVAVDPAGDCHRHVFLLPRELLRYVVVKGSIAIDGISLTVNGIDDAAGSVEVMIVPHTSARTTIGGKGPGAAVNVEVDGIGKYVERLLLGWRTTG